MLSIPSAQIKWQHQPEPQRIIGEHTVKNTKSDGGLLREEKYAGVMLRWWNVMVRIQVHGESNFIGSKTWTWRNRRNRSNR